MAAQYNTTKCYSSDEISKNVSFFEQTQTATVKWLLIKFFRQVGCTQWTINQKTINYIFVIMWINDVTKDIKTAICINFHHQKTSILRWIFSDKALSADYAANANRLGSQLERKWENN